MYDTAYVIYNTMYYRMYNILLNNLLSRALSKNKQWSESVWYILFQKEYDMNIQKKNLVKRGNLSFIAMLFI